MENTITKSILRDTLYSGDRPAIELLYGRYGSMLFGFILQFTPDRKKAEDLLVDIFSRLAGRLQDACDSSLSVYCWLQIEARKIILEYTGHMGQDSGEPLQPRQPHDQEIQDRSEEAFTRTSGSSYIDLLQKATQEQQWVFRELFLKGRRREDLALELSQDKTYIDSVLRESLIILRAHLG